jgi:hypothetical protein
VSHLAKVPSPVNLLPTPEVEQAYRVLLPSTLRRDGPWRKPANALPIDDNVEALINSPRSPKVLDRKELDGRTPYFEARAAVLAAFRCACVEVTTGQIKKRVATLRVLARETAELQKRLEEYRGLVERGMEALDIFPVLPLSRPRPAAPSRGDLRLELDRFLSQLKLFNEAVKFRRQQLSNNQPDYTKYAFADRLAWTWVVLTGTVPSDAGPFTNFVDASWNSVSENEVHWDRTIRRLVRNQRDFWKEGLKQYLMKQA